MKMLMTIMILTMTMTMMIAMTMAVTMMMTMVYVVDDFFGRLSGRVTFPPYQGPTGLVRRWVKMMTTIQ